MWSRSRYTRQPGSLSTRLGIVLRWPIGLVLISWRYLWRITPVYRRDEDGGPDDLPPPIPDGVETDDVQGLADGYGPLLHRRYAVRVVDSRSTPEQVVTLLAADPNSAAPQDAAVFVKSKEAGDTSSGEMEVGDEYVVRMPGPWDGPVRVVHRTPTSFRFATLAGHLEAGQIEFRARCEEPGSELVSRSSRGPAPATGSRTCSTTSCCWPRRSSSTCGPRPAWAWCATAVAGCRAVSGCTRAASTTGLSSRCDVDRQDTLQRWASRVGPDDGRAHPTGPDRRPGARRRTCGRKAPMAQRDYEEQPEAPDLGATVQLETAESLVGPADGNDAVDAGYSPPDRPYALDDDELTVAGQAAGETLDERLAREVPEEVPVDVDRAGRLADPEQLGVMERTDSMEGQDVGIDGGAASAEEAAVHVVDPDPDARRRADPRRPTSTPTPTPTPTRSATPRSRDR